MKILNLGCGTKTTEDPSVVNVDWSFMLWVKSVPLVKSLSGLVLDKRRSKILKELPENILVHNLKKGIPFPDNSVDAVYHSHMLEHLDNEVAARFLIEVKRVLRPGGIHRVVVPDFEYLCRKYLFHITKALKSKKNEEAHDGYIADVIEQSVRREAVGSSRQPKTRRYLENFFFGDARSRGETHQWMYDRVTLKVKLEKAGYKNVKLMSHLRSDIPNWKKMGLDLNENGQEYKPYSLYMEGVK